ncbi:hypothetical protein [Streptomyces cyaneofuscatus]|uniref:hypothetical protein n=1 Tax=Streptomyces cyaneofuscatus TaxID=66883 RepID=UPI0037ABD5F8
MPDLGYAQLPVPAGGDAPVGPAALAALATALDPHLTQHVANQAERDSLYAVAPIHTLVSATDGSLWLKTATDANTWATIYQPLPAWRTISLAAGYESGEITPQVRVHGRQVHVRGRLIRTDGTPFPMGGVKVADVPADCRPAQLGNWAGGASLAGDPMTGVGRMEVLGNSSSSSLGTSGALCWYSQDGIQVVSGTGPSWIDLSGSYWLD